MIKLLAPLATALLSATSPGSFFWPDEYDKPSNPGLTLSTSLDGISQVSHLLSPAFFAHLTSFHVPDVTFSQGTMTNINVTVHEPENPREDLQFCLNPKNNSIVMRVEELKAEIQGDFDVHMLGFHVRGKAFVNASDLQMQTETKLMT
jgi:hypothetical protein